MTNGISILTFAEQLAHTLRHRGGQIREHVDAHCGIITNTSAAALPLFEFKVGAALQNFYPS